MKTEEKAKKYDEALEWMREVYPTLTGAAKEDAEHYFPELKESEDEKIRKEIISFLQDDIDRINCRVSGDYDDRDEDDIEHQNWCKKAIAYLEKQKEANKAIETVEKIDKYIDEHLANAHDMKDSNPEKKYYRGWDDALGIIAAILQDVYSEEKKKEQNSEDEEYSDFTIYHPLKNGKGNYECIPYSFYGSLTSFSEDKDLIDFLRTCFYTEEECNEWIKQQKEQKPVTINQDEKEFLADEITAFLCNYDKEFDGEDPVPSEIAEHFYLLGKQAQEQKSAEWSENDENKLNHILEIVHIASGREVSVDEKEELESFLKSLRPQPKQKPEVKLKGWVARDSKYNSYFGLGLVLFKGKPRRSGECWSGAIAAQLPWESFPDLKWEDEPLEVEIIIRKK